MDTLTQEKTYTFDHFTNDDAFRFGQKVVEIVNEKGYKPVRIRVTYKNDVVFQYFMEGKAGDEWVVRKEKTVLESGHSSLYVFEHPEDFPNMSMETGYAICGGGFPLIVDGVLQGALIVSGLAHDEDHALIIEAIERMKEK